MKDLVIYHANCVDGFGAAYAAWLKLGDAAEYLPMGYHQKLDTELVRDRRVHILDFSLSADDMDRVLALAERVTWLDHHKTAFEMWLGRPPEDEPNERWEHSAKNYHICLDNKRSGALIAAQHYRAASDLRLFQHIDDYDRWQFKMGGTRELNAAIRSYQPWTFEQWSTFVVDDLVREGAALLRDHKAKVQQALKESRKVELHGRVGLAVNASPWLASDLGHELAVQSGTFGAVWSQRGDGRVGVSLRSNGDFDVSAIAKQFGGGGHKNAAGFETTLDDAWEAVQ